jgi:hypothetical protein
MLSGISFIVRVRNEEKTLESSIRSLFNLNIPHEINIILHCCSDKSETIARSLANENKNINIFTYDKKISRAGYETLATDASSEHSIMTYYNYCFGTGKYIWKFKWDADFTASSELIDFLNSKTWEYEEAYYVIDYKMKSLRAGEKYLFCPFYKYYKYLFWEVNTHGNNAKRYVLDEPYFIYHNSELEEIKTYWNEEPWYLTEDSDEARIVEQRIERLTNDFGKEPVGMARALNPDCDSFCINISNTKPSYVNIYS